MKQKETIKTLSKLDVFGSNPKLMQDAQLASDLIRSVANQVQIDLKIPDDCCNISQVLPFLVNSMIQFCQTVIEQKQQLMQTEDHGNLFREHTDQRIVMLETKID